MKKHVLKILDLPSNGISAALMILSVLFLIGSIAGCVFADRVGGNGADALSDYLDGFLSVASSGELMRPEFLVVLWKTVRWPLIAVALGLTPLGLLGIPVLFLIRAFLLSFSIASFFRVFGTQGLLLGFSVFGVTGLICIPVLFVLGLQSFLNAAAIAGRLVGETRRRNTYYKKSLLCLSVCVAMLCISCLLECYTVPAMLGSISGMLLN